ncbi:unnamed protein product [Nezara viridula]|uniref:Uncharacterized protein n=1 Tax=Nezara viridula TaxID=85310 RepID=A0A9P0E5X2_NEZVI|nr:unnamed protein product [Nezara viridula]
MWSLRWWCRVASLYLLILTIKDCWATCPPLETIRPCQCTNKADELQIWCSQSELSAVLSGLAAISAQITRPIDELILENNVITALPGRAFAPLRVTRLMLRNNKLERLSSNWLGGLEPSLLEVFIVEHELRSLPEDVFEGLDKLEAVTIKAGFVQRLPSFSGLKRLRYLLTELPSLTEISPGRLNKLEALEQLHLIRSPRLTNLGPSSLQDAPRLALANFSGSGISWVHPRSFVRLPSLKEIDLSDNQLSDAGEIEIHRGSFHRLPSLVKLDLSNNKIQRIHPEFFLQSYDSQLEEISLVNNELDHVMYLTTILETLPRIKFLDMSNNHMQDIMFGALRGHPTLERLHLNNNLLRRVVREAFSGMPSLRELRLSNNSLSNYLEMPLWNLPNLKGLDLSHNEFRRIDRRVLANLPSLRRLDVSNNNLFIIDPASFLGTTALEHVNLSRNAIDLIQPQTFNHLNNLFEFDMSWNKLTGIVPGLPRALELLHLSNNRITALPRSPSPDLLLPALRLLNLSGNKLGHLPSEALISMPLLRKLLLAENGLLQIDERSLDGLGRLEELDIQDNRINEVHLNAFRDLRRLQELDMSGNRLATIKQSLLLEEVSLSNNALSSFPNPLTKLGELKFLDLSYNRIKQILGPLYNLKSLSYLNLSGNKIETLLEGAFINMGNLTVLDLDNNQIQFISPHVIRSMPSLVTLKLSRNKLATIPSAAFSDLPVLTDIELQQNQISHLASDAFTGVPNLLVMNLSHNHLASLDKIGLHGVKSMEILDISHNRLSKLSNPGIPNLNSLIQLKMDGNNICAIQGSPFEKMTHLRVLSLRKNRLVSISETALQPLRSTIYQIDIEGNPLRCSCTFLWQKTFNQEAYHPPICYDGTPLFQGHKMINEECSHSKYSDLQKSCENNSIGQIQQLSTINNWKGNNEKPTPEESEYFYEYVDYDENISVPLNLTKYTIQTTSATNLVISTAGTTAIPPAVMSHFIPGDTPTLYARPGNDQLKKKKPTKPPSTTFTFFGMPLPSLNIQNLWGSSRNRDGQSRFPGARGSIEPLDKPPKQEEGFKPILYNTGGFRPIFNPYTNLSTSSNSIKTIPSVSSIASNRQVTTVSSSSTLGPTSDPQFHETYNKLVKVIPPKTEIKNSNEVSTLELEEHDETRDEFNQSQKFSFDNYSLQSIYEFNTGLEGTTEGHYSSSTPTPFQFPLTTRTSLDAVQESTIGGNNYVEAPGVKETNTVTGNSPSPLSAFLAPGGQLPPYRSSGRPTITKVTVPPSPIAEEIQAPIPRQAKSTVEETLPKSKSSQIDKSIAWYYQNYNKTNLQPYIGPGIAFPSNQSDSKYLKLNTYLLLFLLLVLAIK